MDLEIYYLADPNVDPPHVHYLYDSKVSLPITNTKLITEVNSIDQFSFTIWPTHPEYDKIKVKETIINVRLNKITLFRGRIVGTTMGMDRGKNVTCEGMLSCLVDTYFVDRAYASRSFINGTEIPDDARSKYRRPTVVFEHHEADEVNPGVTNLLDYDGWINRGIIQFNNDYVVNMNDQLGLGQVCPTVPRLQSGLNDLPYYCFEVGNNPPVEEFFGKSQMEVLKYIIDNNYYRDPDSGEKIEDNRIKYFYASYADMGYTRLNFFCKNDLDNYVRQNIVFGQNLSNINIEENGTSVITAIAPTGEIVDWQNQRTPINFPTWGPGAHKYRDDDDDIYERGVYMFSKSGQKKAGWIIDKPENTKFTISATLMSDWLLNNPGKNESDWLQEQAYNYLKSRVNNIKKTITVNAIDLGDTSSTEEQYMRFKLLSCVYLYAPYHIDQQVKYVVTRIESDLFDPSKDVFTFTEYSAI